MTLVTDIKSALSSAALQVAVGTRVYPLTVPSNASFPAITYNVVDMPPLSSSHDGADRTVFPRVQITVWAVDVLLCESISKLVTTALTSRFGERQLTIEDYGTMTREPNESVFQWIMDFRWTRSYDG